MFAVFFIKEEAFASLIALIFIIESVDKLIAIKNIKKFSNDPFNYVNDYTKSTACLRCVYSGPVNSTFSLNVTLDSLNEKQVFFAIIDYFSFQICYFVFLFCCKVCTVRS